MHILVTRPRGQFGKLTEALSALGHAVATLPLLEIVPLSLEGERSADHARTLASADKIIVVSANAARFAEKLLAAVRLHPGCEIFAIGSATARALRHQGLEVLVPEQKFNSESLLELEALSHVAREQVVILCGVGGREHLETSLAERGARIQRVELYSRVPVALDKLDMDTLLRPDAIIALSGDTVSALVNVLDESGHGDWRHVPLVVPGERVADLACTMQFSKIFRASGPDLESLLVVLSELAQEV